MKKVFLFFTLIAVYNLCLSQNPYYDALKLKSLGVGNHAIKGTQIYQLQDNNNVYKIMKSYMSPEDTNSKESIARITMRNPFFQWDTSVISHSALPAGLAGIVSGMGGLDVTNFADGLSKFLIKRAKTELSLAFFKKFKDDLNKTEYQDLKILFPQTYKTLQLIDTDIYQFSLYLNTLREAFIKDLTTEFANIQKLFEQPLYKDYLLNKHPELGSVLNSALYVINELAAGKHPGDVLANYSADSQINICNVPHCTQDKTDLQTNLRGSIKTIQLFSSSIKSRSTSDYWVPADSVRMLIENPITFKIYLGLLYQSVQNKDIAFSNAISLKVLLKKIAVNYDSVTNDINQYREFIIGLANQAQEVNGFVKEIKAKSKTDIDFNDYYKVFDASLDLFELSGSFIDLPYVELGNAMEANIKKSSAKVIYVSRSFADLYVDIRSRNYASGILNTITLLDSLTEISTSAKSKIFKYGTFMAAVAQAQNADEVQAAIEAVAMPAGSYSVKRNSGFNIAVQAYVGVAYDWANPAGMKPEIRMMRDNNNMNWSMAAPVGLNFSFGRVLWNSSLSLFVSIIDVGGLANFRLNNDTIALTRKITLADIISPGANFVYGIPKSPLSLSCGLVYKPALFYDNHASSLISLPGMFRCNVSLLVDIPLVNLFNRSARFCE